MTLPCLNLNSFGSKYTVPKKALAGPSPRFSSRGAKNQKEGPKTRRGGHIFKIQCWMYAATGGSDVKWGGADFKRGAGHHWPPAGDGPGYL